MKYFDFSDLKEVEKQHKDDKNKIADRNFSEWVCIISNTDLLILLLLNTNNTSQLWDMTYFLRVTSPGFYFIHLIMFLNSIYTLNSNLSTLIINSFHTPTIISINC